MIERVEIDGVVYRRADKVLENVGGQSVWADSDDNNPQSFQDFFIAFVPEERFGIKYPEKPIIKVS